MARQANKLTAAKVKAEKRPGVYPDGAGLFLQVTLSRVTGEPRRSWLVRYDTPEGKRREMGLGPTSEVDLATARDLAREVRVAARAGRDPIKERKDRRETAKAAAARAEAVAAASEARTAGPGVMTFREAAESYIASHEAGWRNEKHGAQWRSTLKTYAYPIMGAVPVADVDGEMVLAVLNPIWREKTETASRLRSRIELVLDSAKARGHRSGENPARWKGNLEHLLPSRSTLAPVKHHSAVPAADLPTVFAAIAARNGVGAECLRFLILTAARYGEAVGATWGEIDLKNAVWSIPAERMKARRAHRVPLSAAAIEILKARLAAVGEVKPDKLVFESDMRKGAVVSQSALMEVLKRVRRNETVHGFRSTFRQWVAEETEFPREIAEAALAHVNPNKVEAAYQRGDFLERRRALMDAWGAFCLGAAKERAA